MATASTDVEALADEAIDLTVELVRIDTVNPALVEGAPGESDAVALLSDRLARHGFEIEVIDATGRHDRPSLVATARGSGNGPNLMLNGHLDTVGTHGMTAPQSARIEGDRHSGRLHGRGACDMKGGVAAMVVAAEQIVAAGAHRGDIVLALVADEEHASIGAEAVIDHLSSASRLPDVCLVAEPTWLDLVVAHRGFDVVDVELTGRAAHTSQADRGVDAIRHLGRLLAAVEDHDWHLAELEPHPIAGRGSLLASVVGGGSAPFTIADGARATIERRTLPGEPTGTGLREVEDLLARLGANDPSLDARARLTLTRAAWEAGTDELTELALDVLGRELARAGHSTSQRSGAPYWMESAMWAAAGVPAVVCGPAGGGMHAIDEWLDLAQLRAFTTAVHQLITAVCGSSS